MAFTTDIETDSGRQLLLAYVRARVARCDKNGCIVILDVWESSVSRESHPNAPVCTLLRSYSFETILPSDNPVDYAYQIVEASGEFASAVWNV